MLMRIWSKESTPPLLAGAQTCTATMETNTAVPQKDGDQSISRASVVVILVSLKTWKYCGKVFLF